MKSVGVREFRDHATKYLAGDEALAIERHGEPIGYYIPSKRKRREEMLAAMEKLQHTIQEVMAQTGLTEDQLSELFDVKRPLPDWAVADENNDVSGTHAASS